MLHNETTVHYSFHEGNKKLRNMEQKEIKKWMKEKQKQQQQGQGQKFIMERILKYSQVFVHR